MFRSMIPAFVTSLLMTAAFVTAEAHAQPDATSVAAPGAEAAPQKAEKKICKRQARTGTRLSADRICKTAAEWDRVERETREDVSKMTEMRGDTDMGQ